MARNKKVKLVALEETFEQLEASFKQLDTKLEAKINSINESYDQETIKIDAKFDIDQIDQHKIHLIQSKQTLLNNLKSKRVEKLKQLNEFHANNELNPQNFAINLASFKLNLYQNYLYLKCNQYNCTSLLWNKYKLNQVLAFNKLVAYSSFIAPRRSLKYEIPSGYYLAGININGIDFASLPLDQILAYLVKKESKTNHRMLIIDHNGNIVHAKDFVFDNESIGCLKVSPTNIIYMRTQIGFASTVDIYNFKLEQVYKFYLDDSYHSYCLNYSNVVIFKAPTKNKITVFDLNRFKSKEIKTKMYGYLESFSNENFYYLKHKKMTKYDELGLVIIDILKSEVVASLKFKFDKELCNRPVKLDFNYNIYFINCLKSKIEIYSPNGVLQSRIELDLRYTKFYFSTQNKVIFNIDEDEGESDENEHKIYIEFSEY